MLGIAAYVGVFAYGRMAKAFSNRVWLILVSIAVATTFLSMLLEKAGFSLLIVFTMILQLAVLIALFLLGLGLGRWLDRNKGLD